MDNRDIVRLRKDETARLNPERATIITVAWNNAIITVNAKLEGILSARQGSLLVLRGFNSLLAKVCPKQASQFLEFQDFVLPVFKHFFPYFLNRPWNCKMFIGL